MAEEFETVELEVSEDDIEYYLVDEDGNEIGFVIIEDGAEVECYYEGYDSEDFEIVDDVVVTLEEDSAAGDGTLADHDGEVVEVEVSDDDIEYYLVDENGNEIGFVIVEDGVEVECYYEEDDTTADGPSTGDSGAPSTDKPAEPAEPYVPEKAEEHGYLHKLASIAGHEGNKARKKAGVELDKVRDKAEVKVDKAKKAAAEQAGKAKKVATEQAGRAKAKASENDLGITREGIKETTADLNAIAKEGAETAKELKEAYDDIMDSFGFLVPNKVRRRLP